MGCTAWTAVTIVALLATAAALAALVRIRGERRSARFEPVAPQRTADEPVPALT